MNGSSQYGFEFGYVTITKEDNMAPNDAELKLVRDEMEHRLNLGAWAYHFPVRNMVVDVMPTHGIPSSVSRETIYAAAIRPLQAKDYKPDHTPDHVQSALLGASAGTNWDYRPSPVGFHSGWWVFKDGEDIHVSISDHTEVHQFVVCKWWGLLPNIEACYGTLDEAKHYVETAY